MQHLGRRLEYLFINIIYIVELFDTSIGRGLNQLETLITGENRTPLKLRGLRAEQIKVRNPVMNLTSRHDLPAT